MELDCSISPGWEPKAAKVRNGHILEDAVCPGAWEVGYCWKAMRRWLVEVLRVDEG